MTKLLLLTACVAAVAGCNSEPKVDEKDASVAEVAKKVREAGADQAFVRPGQWQSVVTIDKLDVPGMPPEVAQRMKTMMAERQAHSFRTCLTKEDVQRPKEDFFAGKDNACRYDRFTMGGGKIDAVMRCGREGAQQTMQMAGTYPPDNYQMQMSTQVEAPSGGSSAQAMTMQMRVEARRIGECSGTEAS